MCCSRSNKLISSAFKSADYLVELEMDSLWAPQLGAALAYYTVFSLAPLVLILLAIVGMIFRDDPAGAWQQLTEQMSYFLDRTAVQLVQNIAQKAAQPGKSTLATIIGIALALFGATGVFGQLQDALNTIW